jgi:hypothetical protein
VETNKNRILAPLLALDKMAEAHWAVVWTIDLDLASLYLSNYGVFKSMGSAIKAISIMKYSIFFYELGNWKGERCHLECVVLQ